jgi:hypothetical protein
MWCTTEAHAGVKSVRHHCQPGLLKTALTLLALAMLVGLSGCATTEDPELPWNTPQQWEGHPTIPGLSPY